MKKLIKTIAVVFFILSCLFVILTRAQEKPISTAPAPVPAAASPDTLTPAEQADLSSALTEERDRAKDLEIARARANEATAARVALVRGFYAEHGFKLSTHDLKVDKDGVWSFVEKAKAKP